MLKLKGVRPMPGGGGDGDDTPSTMAARTPRTVRRAMWGRGIDAAAAATAGAGAGAARVSKGAVAEANNSSKSAAAVARGLAVRAGGVSGKGGGVERSVSPRCPFCFLLIVFCVDLLVCAIVSGCFVERADVFRRKRSRVCFGRGQWRFTDNVCTYYSTYAPHGFARYGVFFEAGIPPPPPPTWGRSVSDVDPFGIQPSHCCISGMRQLTRHV